MIFAYIDPGAGSLVIQALIAALISVPFVFRATLKRAMLRVRTIVHRRGHGSAESDERQLYL